MITSTRAITYSSYLSMLFLGVSSSLVGAAARSIGLSPFQIGLLIAVQNLGFMVAVLVTGALADSHEKPRLLFLGSVVLAISLFLFYLGDDFAINLVIMAFIGVGIGAYEGVTDAMLLDIHHERQNYFININHFFVTIGSIVIALYLWLLPVDWRSSVVTSSVIVAVLALVFGLTRLASPTMHHDPYLDRVKILARERTVLALFLATLLVVGAELSATGILTTFLTEMRGFSQTAAQAALVLFLVGIAVGRVVIGRFSHNAHVPRNILLLFGLSLACFTALFFWDFGSLTVVFVFMAGLSMSALVPLMLTLAGLLYVRVAGTVLGAIKVAIAVGGIFVPLLLSVVVSRISFQAALLLFPLAFLSGLLILAPTLRGIRTPL